MSVKVTKVVECCGECPLFQYEDAYGFGICKADRDSTYCGNKCVYRKPHYKLRLSKEGAAAVLHQFQKYRRGGGDMLPPALYGIAIDTALAELRKNGKK